MREFIYIFIYFYINYINLTNNGTNTSETIDINLIKIFNDGPDVSLNGSPTVSPTTAALCLSEPFYPLCIQLLFVSYRCPKLHQHLPSL